MAPIFSFFKLALSSPTLLILSLAIIDGTAADTPGRAGTKRFPLPAPAGPYPVGRTRFELIDRNRADPYAPGFPNKQTPRSIVVNLFYPAVDPPKETYSDPFGPYLPLKAAPIQEAAIQAPNGTFSLVQPQSRQNAKARWGIHPASKVVVFGTGLGGPPEFYHMYMENLASYGNVVIGIDHTYENVVTEFPDGRLVFGMPLDEVTSEELLGLLWVRVGDIRFALDELKKSSVMKRNVPGARRGLNTDKVAVLGHSFGGSAAASAALVDKRVQGGLNMDGSVQGEVLTKGLDKPYVLMGRPDHNRTSDESWSQLWENLRGFKLHISVEGTKHSAFMDLPVVADMLGLKSVFPPGYLESQFGVIDALRSSVVVNAYLKGFVDRVLWGKKVPLLEGPDPKFPEVNYDQ